MKFSLYFFLKKAGILLLLAVVSMSSGCSRFWDADEELSQRYDVLIREAAGHYQLEPELLKAVVWKETRFHAEQVGSKGEIGLMQLMPAAVSDWAKAKKRTVPSREELFTPEMNLEIGAWYLWWCGERFKGYNPSSRDIIRLAVYNAGVGRVRDKWLPSDPKEELKLEDISYPSTRDYIRKILAKRDYYKAQND